MKRENKKLMTTMQMNTNTDTVRMAVKRLNCYCDEEIVKKEKKEKWPHTFPSHDLYLLLAVVDGLLDHYEKTAKSGK